MNIANEIRRLKFDVLFSDLIFGQNELAMRFDEIEDAVKDLEYRMESLEK